MVFESRTAKIKIISDNYTKKFFLISSQNSLTVFGYYSTTCFKVLHHWVYRVSSKIIISLKIFEIKKNSQNIMYIAKVDIMTN